MLKVVHDTDAPNENGTAGGSLLDEIVRDGARAMLAAALQAEVAAYIDAHLGEVDEAGHRLVVRNGFPPAAGGGHGGGCGGGAGAAGQRQAHR